MIAETASEKMIANTTTAMSPDTNPQKIPTAITTTQNSTQVINKISAKNPILHLLPNVQTTIILYIIIHQMSNYRL